MSYERSSLRVRRLAGAKAPFRSAVSTMVATALVALGVAVAAPASAASTTLYVAQAGDDTANTCAAAAAPCATVGHALTQAAPGATINVSGTIPGTFTVPGSLSPVTIAGTRGAPAILDGEAAGSVVYNSATLTLRDVIVQNGLGGNGGGILNGGGTLLLDHATVRNNTGTSGGGVYVWYGSLTAVDSTFTGNTATGLGDGGALYVGHGSISVRRSTLSGNHVTSGYGGAVSTWDKSPVTITDSTVSGNSASKGGGLEGQDLTVTRSTVSGNTAGFGGGIWNSVGTVTLTQSTIAGNSDSGIFNDGGTVRLAGSVLGPNSQPNCAGNLPNTWTSGGYNVASDGSCPLAVTGDVVNADPQLGALSDNGGPTATMMPGLAGAAAARIPADTVANATTMCPHNDQRGVPGPAPGQTACASGAVEPTAFVLTDQGTLTVTTTDGSYGQPLTLGTSGGSGEGAVTYAASGGTASDCTVSPAAPYTLTSTSAGTCIVTATKEAGGIYRVAQSAPTTVTFGKVAQAPLSLTSTSGTAAVPLTLATSGGSGTGATTYAAVDDTATGCAVSASEPYTLTSSSAGTCTVTATRAGDLNYLPVSATPTTVTIGKAAQSALVVTSTSGDVGTPLTLTTSGGSGTGAVTYTTADGSATGCAVSATAPYTLSTATAGTCVVTATRAGDGTYDAATSLPTTVTLNVPAPPAQTTVPGAVGGLAVSGRATSPRRLASWTAPATDGGAAVTGYRVVVRKGTKVVRTTTVTGTRVVLRRGKLPAGTLKVVVQALNRIGGGPAVSKSFVVRK